MHLIQLINIATCLDPMFVPSIMIRGYQQSNEEEHKDYPSFLGSEDSPTPFASEDEVKDTGNDNTDNYRIVQ